MSRPNLVTQYLNAPLPTVMEQKKFPFRPNVTEVDSLYRAINRCVFDNQLTQPEITLYSLKDCWASCSWELLRQRRSSWGKSGTWCTIQLNDKWYSPQWMVTILAHEMVHQWQWDVYRWQHLKRNKREMFLLSGAHGPSFHSWRGKMEEWGIWLKITYSDTSWWRHQDLFRC